MSDSGEVEVEAVSGYQVLPKEVTEEIGSIKLFNKWYAAREEESPRRPGGN
jgi:small subunit ribosomal protein S5e